MQRIRRLSERWSTGRKKHISPQILTRSSTAGTDDSKYISYSGAELRILNSDASLSQACECPSDIYMEEETQDSEGDVLKTPKSMITHLLSQVKIGMDMTKITLPIYILEQRSLLEMYADFFSHADYFVQIAQKPTPEDRFIACVRFFLSTIAAGRRSSLAKKPYNPIMGEMFRCFWDHPSLPMITQPAKRVADGPVPWAQTNQVTFIAEQVSHHPPVSAFYAEHWDQKIQFTGHIWTKSKFLGLSVAVHNVGQGVIRVLEHHEEYVMTFPSGYGRSILTTPWIELGGDCSITCQKTGYSAHIIFHTKPFYGGKPHKVTGTVLKEKVNKPVCTFSGEWNTKITCNYTHRDMDFIDASKPKFPKFVHLISKQKPMESRRLWQHVTRHLKTNKIEDASSAKSALEEQQRDDAKRRAGQNIKYKPTHFYQNNQEKWIYKSELVERI